MNLSRRRFLQLAGSAAAVVAVAPAAAVAPPPEPVRLVSEEISWTDVKVVGKVWTSPAAATLTRVPFSV